MWRKLSQYNVRARVEAFLGRSEIGVTDTGLLETGRKLEPTPELRRSKRIASASLAASASVYIGLGFIPGSHWVIDALRATAEAAIIGGLADWFAVVALFRHPLGLPIPHTGILPENKDRIGTALGRFAQEHLLDPEELAKRLAAADMPGHLAAWLRTDRNAGMLAGEVARMLPQWLASFDDSSLKAGVKAEIRGLIAHVDLVSIADDILITLLKRGEHLAIIDDAASAGLVWLDNKKGNIEGRLYEGIVRYTASYFKGSILDVIGLDPRYMARSVVANEIAQEIADSFVSEVREYLIQARIHDSELRKDLDKNISERIGNLKNSEEWAARLNGLRSYMLDEKEFDRRFDTIWATLRLRAMESVAASSEDINKFATEQLAAIGDAMIMEDELRSRVNAYLTRVAREAIEIYRGEVGPYVAGVVKHWDPVTMSKIVENQVGKDLQFIRINGTIVGGLGGLALFVINSLF